MSWEVRSFVQRCRLWWWSSSVISVWCCIMPSCCWCCSRGCGVVSGPRGSVARVVACGVGPDVPSGSAVGPGLGGFSSAAARTGVGAAVNGHSSISMLALGFGTGGEQPGWLRSGFSASGAQQMWVLTPETAVVEDASEERGLRAGSDRCARWADGESSRKSADERGLQAGSDRCSKEA